MGKTSNTPLCFIEHDNNSRKCRPRYWSQSYVQSNQQDQRIARNVMSEETEIQYLETAIVERMESSANFCSL